LDGEIGAAKVEALGRRMRAISPEMIIHARQEFFTAETKDALLAPKYDYVFDAIDTLANKALLIAECHRRKIPVIASGGAGGRKDATAVRIADLSQASH